MAAVVEKSDIDIEEISELEGDSRPLTFFSRGHHPFEDFIKKLDFEYGADYEIIYPGLEFSEKYMIHTHARKCPWMGFHEYQYLPASKGKRGAFPVTEYDINKHISDWYTEKREMPALAESEG